MYCPKCEKTIRKERFDELKKELQDRFENDSLSQGLCPVCGTPLIELSRRDD